MMTVMRKQDVPDVGTASRRSSGASTAGDDTASWHKCRPVRGQVTMGADSSCKSTLHALLHVNRDELIVKGGERLQEELLRMPISEVLVCSAPETGTESSERALFRIHTNTHDLTLLDEGVVVETASTVLQEKWLDAFTERGITVLEGPNRTPRPPARACGSELDGEHSPPRGALRRGPPPLVLWID